MNTGPLLRGDSVFCLWSISVYGYSKWLVLVTIVALFMARSWHGIEGRCPANKASKTDCTMKLSAGGHLC